MQMTARLDVGDDAERRGEDGKKRRTWRLCTWYDMIWQITARVRVLHDELGQQKRGECTRLVKTTRRTSVRFETLETNDLRTLLRRCGRATHRPCDTPPHRQEPAVCKTARRPAFYHAVATINHDDKRKRTSTYKWTGLQHVTEAQRGLFDISVN